MLTFITVSRDPEKVKKLQDNLGVVFRVEPPELIVRDGNQEDLFQGYNRGAEDAANNLLCFIHDDVTILGNEATFGPLITLLNKPLTGAVGVAGSRHLPGHGAWWRAPHEECRGMAGHPSPGGGIQWNCWPHGAARFGPVAVLDGLFLACHRRTFNRLQGFAEKTYQGFHAYDIDFTFRATLAGLTNQVVPIPLFHNSHGQTNEGWETNMKIFRERYRDHLPYQLR